VGSRAYPRLCSGGAFLNGRYLLRLGEKGEEHGPASVKETAWKNSLAVLPFVNMSADPEQEYFCDGLTEELITKMSQIRELKVPARTPPSPSREVCRRPGDRAEAGVANVLEGSVRKSSSRIRISAQLISTTDGYHLWSETYDRDLDDIFAVQEEIARSVAGRFKSSCSAQKKPFPRQRTAKLTTPS